jgi:hypothetical protein
MRNVLSLVVFGSLVATAGVSGCVGMEELSNESTGELGNAKSAPKLNLSHIECQADGTVNAHFVLLFWGASQPPALNGTYNGGSFGPVEATKTTGNVWHYNVTLPAGYIEIYSATVGSVSLHNPGEYGGDYLCGPEGPVCSVPAVADDLLCLDSPLGKEGAECAYFGLLPIGKDDNLSGFHFNATMDAYLAIVKSGAAACSPGQTAYRIYTNVTEVPATDLEPPVSEDGTAQGEISHITYCECPDQ